MYFARPDSLVFGESVNEVRTNLGRILARESAVPADVVVPVPDSGRLCRCRLLRGSGVPLQFGLIRNHYVGRTFIEPQQSIRHFGVKVKLNPVRSILEGRRVVLIDDSIVRGTTSRKIVKMIKAAGAKEVHVRISCPPTISPCFYGIDTPRRAELIAATHTLEEVRKYIEADSLQLPQPRGPARRPSTRTATDYCTSCYTGTVSACRSPATRRSFCRCAALDSAVAVASSESVGRIAQMLRTAASDQRDTHFYWLLALIPDY